MSIVHQSDKVQERKKRNKERKKTSLVMCVFEYHSSMDAHMPQIQCSGTPYEVCVTLRLRVGARAAKADCGF